ncbi:MAG: histidine triad nucleotide-binding protein [Ignavibacteriales bacterium CG_4_9_14_3_um_filter_34_10]|nr:MAG: histidine triad nucleotide-binding protein [Ignavibacteriales bacterium CG_4_9_14_3_um_filter_34_10]
METVFSKIISKEIPAKIVFESENVLAFHDINPQAPVHVLIIPKTTEINSVRNFIAGAHDKIIGEMLSAAKTIAKDLNIFDSGFRLVINNGADSGQEVPHLHIHLLGGRKFTWPPG